MAVISRQCSGKELGLAEREKRLIQHRKIPLVQISNFGDYLSKRINMTREAEEKGLFSQ